VTAPNPNTVGIVSVEETWGALTSKRRTALIDVRTAAEWSFVGVPDLAQAGKSLIQVEWQRFPGGEPNENFADMVQRELNRLGAGQDTELFFICRSGVRSMMAAQTMAAAGYTHCHNVADGFEGHLDAARHRGHAGGWKARGLPWVQG
jgi:rhodanese-related sulfurtransferase